MLRNRRSSSPALIFQENNPRKHRIAEEIKKALCQIFRNPKSFSPEFELVSVTVTEVVVDSHLKYAKVYVMSLGGDKMEPVLLYLKKQVRYFRHQLGQLISFKFLPKIEFLPDETFDRATRINGLLKSFSKKELN